MTPEDARDSRRAALSALMDGDATAADDACRCWQSDAAARADWRTYHLIGDLLRSDEHRCDAAHDARFVAALHERLVVEPAVLAPVPVAPQRRASRPWLAPAAVAAGFLAVAGALVVTRTAVPGGQESARDSLAVAPATGSGVQVVATQGAAPQASAAAADKPAMIRSAELDRYLAAHRQYANASTLAAPGGVVRSVAAAAPGR